MAKEYPNFYENLKEAHMRLRSTIVLYDGVPYYVLAITNHKNDGIFRVYLGPLFYDENKRVDYPDTDNYTADNPGLGVYLDNWLDAHPQSVILRKKMDSSYFNRFRPFPLGMCNFGSNAYYLERQPQRHREQGLTRPMIAEARVTAGVSRGPNGMGMSVEMHTAAFRDCVTASHPTAHECLKNLLDPAVENEAVAFNRHFALVRGPIDMLFLAYKTDVVGVLPKSNFEYLRIGKEFRHTREVIEGLKLFANIS